MKKGNLWWVLPVVFGLASFVFCSCSRTRTLSTELKPKSVKITKAGISGNWGQYLKVLDGAYSFSLSDAEQLHTSNEFDVYTATLSTSLKMELIKTYTGDISQLVEIIALIPKNKKGFGDLELYPTDMERFADLLTGEAGMSSIIKFESQPIIWSVKKRRVHDANGLKSAYKLHLKPVTGFELISVRYRPTVIAVAPVAPGRNMEGSETEDFQMRVLSNLKKNPMLKRAVFVDTGKVNAIMEQHKFQASDWSNSNKAAQIGEALNANVLAVGTIRKETARDSEGKAIVNYVASVQLMNINTMAIIYTADDSKNSLNGLFEQSSTLHLHDAQITLR